MFKLANRVARHDEILHRCGVVGGTSQSRGLQECPERARLYLFRAAHDEFRFGQIKVRSDREIIDPGDESGQADDRPQPDVQRPEEPHEQTSRARAGSGTDGDGAAEGQDPFER